MTNTIPASDDDAVPPTDEVPTLRTPDDCPVSLTAAVVERGDGLDECMLYPADADEEALVTEWITAEEGSYVELDSMR
jgi:hypothetical protein